MVTMSDAMPQGLPRIVMEASEGKELTVDQMFDLQDLAQWLRYNEIKKVDDLVKMEAE